MAFVALPFYFQSVLGMTAVQTGLLLTPWPVMTAVMAPIAGPLSDRFPPAILGGFGAGFGFFQSPNLKAIMSSAPPERSGGASGIVATSRLVGQATGAALVAFCFGLSMHYGPSLALGVAAIFAGSGSVVSFSRLATSPRRSGRPRMRD